MQMQVNSQEELYVRAFINVHACRTYTASIITLILEHNVFINWEKHESENNKKKLAFNIRAFNTCLR